MKPVFCLEGRKVSCPFLLSFLLFYASSFAAALRQPALLEAGSASDVVTSPKQLEALASGGGYAEVFARSASKRPAAQTLTTDSHAVQRPCPARSDEETGGGHFEAGFVRASIPKPYGPTRLHKFDLTDFGGKGDGVTDNTRIFANAIYAVSIVSEKGGGQLFIPPGRYLTGCFNLTSHMTLYLAKNATLVATTNTTFWPVLPPLPSYGRGRELPGPRYSSLIFGQDLTDVIITGSGMIDGQGAEWWSRARRKQLQFSRGPLIQFLWSTDVAVVNVTLVNSPYWNIHTVYCSNVTIGSLTVSTPDDAPNAGGIIPDSSSNVLIENCDIRTGDDCINIKSGWDEYGTAYNQSSSGVVVRGCNLRCANGGALSIGSEMSGGVRDVLYDNVRIVGSHAGFRLKTSPGRGGFVVGVTLRNVTMESVGVAFSFLPQYGDHADDKYDPTALPRVADFTFEDVTGCEISTAGVLEGLANAPFKKINITHVHLGLTDGGEGFTCINVIGTAKDVIPEICKELRPGGSPARLEVI